MWVMARGSGTLIAHLTVLARLVYFNLRRVVQTATIVAEPVIEADGERGAPGGRASLWSSTLRSTGLHS